MEQIVTFFSSIFKKDKEDDPTKLRIKIPKCTFVLCQSCKKYYVSEDNLYCPCLKKNEED
jgi:hypothetical protein